MDLMDSEAIGDRLWQRGYYGDELERWHRDKDGTAMVLMLRSKTDLSNQLYLRHEAKAGRWRASGKLLREGVLMVWRIGSRSEVQWVMTVVEEEMGVLKAASETWKRRNGEA